MLGKSHRSGRINATEELFRYRLDIKDPYVWISVDETSNKIGQPIANLVIGKFCKVEVSNSLTVF